MTYKIEQIEGIGTHYGHKLMSVGVFTTHDLLDRCATPDKLNELVLTSDISPVLLATWNRQADLMRVSGIGPEFGELLESSGIESVAELAIRKPENITHLLARVNEEKRLTRAVPALKTVEGWVERAKVMTGGTTTTLTEKHSHTTAPLARNPPANAPERVAALSH